MRFFFLIAAINCVVFVLICLAIALDRPTKKQFISPAEFPSQRQRYKLAWKQLDDWETRFQSSFPLEDMTEINANEQLDRHTLSRTERQVTVPGG